MQLVFGVAGRRSRPGFAWRASADNTDNVACPRTDPGKVEALDVRRVRQVRIVRAAAGVGLTPGCSDTEGQ